MEIKEKLFNPEVALCNQLLEQLLMVTDDTDVVISRYNDVLVVMSKIN